MTGKSKIDIDCPYLRVGTCYFKIIDHPLASKDTIRKIVQWSGQAISEDHGAKYKTAVPKYDSFCNIPDNIDYHRVFRNSYNMYEPPEHEIKEGKFPRIEMFLSHIFGEQYEIGLDYLTIIWRYPTQILPILCFVSIERNTGKTTFLNFLKAVYGHNMTINTNEDFRNNFNSGWASKLIIGVDEVLLDKKEDVERIKNLSTTKSIKSESKGKDKIEQEFYGKFILCANNENDFIKIAPQEIRFWVRKVEKIEHDNIYLLAQMKSEIPAFLYFLTNRKVISENKTRMWFTKEQLHTEALKKVIQSGNTKLENEIKLLIKDQILINNLNEIALTPKDIIELLKSENNVNNITLTDVKKIIDEKWGYQPVTEPKYYTRYKWLSDVNENYYSHEEKKQGRFYTFNKDEFVNENI